MAPPSTLSRSNSLILPTRSIEESLRQSFQSNNSFPSTSTTNQSSQIFKETTTAQTTSNMRPNVMSDSGSNTARLTKRRRSGRGRMMKVKVYYSLTTPSRNSEASTSALPSPAPVKTPINDSPYTSSFLAVLDPSLAPSPSTNFNLPSPQVAPSPLPESQLNQYTSIARVSAPVWVQLFGNSNHTLSADGSRNDVIEYGKLTMKLCLSAICVSRPELVADPSKDYAVSAVDPYESSMNPTSTSIPEVGINSGRTGQGLMEGKGMLSWNLAEKREGTTFVIGRVVNDGNVNKRASKRRKLEDNESSAEGEDESEEEEGSSETLEVWLKLVEGPSFSPSQFITSLRSFGNSTNATSDKASPPPPRQSNPTLLSQSQSNNILTHPQSGDPVKRKRSRTISEQQQPLQQQSQSQSRPQLQSRLQQSQSLSQPQPTKSRRQALPVDVSVASTSASTATAEQPFDIATLRNPEVLGLLTQLFPELATATGIPSSINPPAFTLDSAQGQALLPAIRTLAKFYGVEVPGVVSAVPDLQVEKVVKVKDLEVKDLEVNSISSTIGQNINNRSIYDTNNNSGKDKGKGKASIETGTFEIVPQEESDKTAKGGGGTYNPYASESGCSNCRRKKSALWRMRKEKNDTELVLVCNPCGIYYNKNGHHRTKGDRTTSPAVPTQIQPLKPSIPSASRSNSTGGKPLQGQLTASCESDLLRKTSSKKSKRSSSSTAGRTLIVPASPSKYIGPNRSSPKSIFRNGGVNHHRNLQNGTNHFMTSPVRSPRNRAMRGDRSISGGIGSNSFSNMLLGLSGSATSPLRNSTNPLGTGMGLRSGYESGGINVQNSLIGEGGKGGAAEVFDFSTLYGGQQSPSPIKPTTSGLNQVSEYLLTASPGTALKRILIDTNVDLNSFGMLDAESEVLGNNSNSNNNRDGDLGSDNFDGDLNFFLRSTPEEEKENGNPNQSFPFNNNNNNNNNYLPPPTTTDGPSTDFFDSVLSSLRRDFDTRLPNSNSNALTSPSSPVPSSPCVQPRTSSATPGQKSKQPMSSGRAPPSILDSFIDGLVPAFALNHTNEDADTPTESDGWTPLSGNGDHDALDLESILALGAGTKVINNDSSYNLSHLLRSSRSTGRSYLPSHLLGGGMTSDSSTSLGDHYQQSRHQQSRHQPFDFGSLPPSSPPLLTTPSDFDGITPDGREDEDRTMVYRLPNERIEDPSTLAPVVSTGEVAKQEAIAALLATFGLSSTGALETQLLEMLQNKGGAVVNEPDASNVTKAVAGGEDHDVKMLYDSLF